MREDFPQTITAKTEVKFTISELGIYAISITARCKVKDDLRVEIDNHFFREIPPKDNIQKFDIPPAWNGTKLKGRSQTNIFLLQLDRGEHVVDFIPEGQVTVEEYSYWQIEDPTHVEFNLNQQAEEGNKRPWFTFALLDLPLKSIVSEITVDWHYFDGDDVKLIIDNQVEKNPDSKFWKELLWHATPKQLLSGPKREQKIVTRDLPEGIHYIELWADQTPTLHQIILDLGGFQFKRTPTVENPRWTGDFFDDTEQLLLARLIVGEMEGQSREAKLGAGFTVINRLKKAKSNWGRSMHEVILKEGQYDAFWNDNTKDKVRDPLNHVAQEEWRECYKVAGIVIGNKEKDPTLGATNFYSTATDIGFPW